MAHNASQLKSLNGIRGFAVLLVLLSHASNDGVLLSENINFSGAGHYGVFLFFVLSSFLLTRQFLVSERKEIFSKKFLHHYFLRRFLRIYPLFLAALIVYYLLNKLGLFIVPVTGKMIAKSLFLLDAEGLFWTVPVEFQFYFVLPIVAYLLAVHCKIVVKIVGCSLFCISWTYFFPPEYSVVVMPFIPVFVLGSLAAACYVSLESRAGFLICNRPVYYDLFAFLSMLLFILLVPRIHSFLLPTIFSGLDMQHQFIFWGLLSSIFVFTVLCSNGVMRKLFESSFLVFWGKVSYSAYLGHKMMLAFVNELDFVSSPVQFVLFFALTALLSFFSYRYFERPLLNLGMFNKVISTMNFGGYLMKGRLGKKLCIQQDGEK